MACLTRSKGNTAYLLDVGSTKVPVYCHMTTDGLDACGGGGWTLVMKIDGSKVLKTNVFTTSLVCHQKLNVQKLINYVVTHQQVYSPYCPISYRASAWHYPIFFGLLKKASFKMADNQSKTSNKRILFRRNIDQYSLGESA